MILIGLCGAAGSGKDTVAGHLAINHGYRVLAFAGPLYDAVAAITGLTVSELRDRRLKEKPIEWVGKSPRELLQLMGTEFGRNMIREDIWIRRAMMDVEEATCDCVITDVRFDNEAVAIRDAGGVIVEVVRPGTACLDAEAAKHASEAGIPRHHISATITNNGTVADLADSADAVVASLHADIM